LKCDWLKPNGLTAWYSPAISHTFVILSVAENLACDFWRVHRTATQLYWQLA